MGLINRLLQIEKNQNGLGFYSGGIGGKGYIGGGGSPGMKSANDFYLINENSKPLITFDINLGLDQGNSDVNGIGTLQGLADLNLSGVAGGVGSGDFILRGGSIAPLRSAIDVARLNRWADSGLNRLQFF